MTREEAIAAGINRYTPSVSCRNGHVCERIASTNKCVECHRATKLRYDAAHPDRKAARNLKWQKNNREKVRETNRQWASENRWSARNASKKHYQKCKEDTDKIILRAKKVREWQIKNPEKKVAQTLRWQKRYPDKVCAKSHTRRARIAGAKGRFSSTDIDRLFELQRGRCAHVWCRKSIKDKKHIDHVIALAVGGSNEPSNLQLLCPSCNCSKGTKHPIEVARQNGMLL